MKELEKNIFKLFNIIEIIYINYGVDLIVGIKKDKKKRWHGEGIIEQVVDAQKLVNKLNPKKNL